MSDAELTKAMIVNWALAELGLKPNFSIDEETTLGAVVDIFWPRCMGRCFGLHDWPFCRETQKLTRQEATPVNGYAYGFTLPDGRIGVPQKVTRDPQNKSPVRDWRIEGDTLFCNEETVYAVVKLQVDPAAWDPQFADCFAVALASYLAVPLLQDLELAAEKEKRAFGTAQEGGAGGMFGRLIAQARTAGPVAEPMEAHTLAGGRTDGPWYGRF